MNRAESRHPTAYQFSPHEMTPATSTATPERRLEPELLLLEFSHRINNEFASMIGSLSIASARTKNHETRTALTIVAERLHGYAQVHQALRMPESSIQTDAAAYLRNLCRAICRSKLDDKGIELIFVDHPLKMSSERCWRLGLIVTELITNAARHAFRESGGTIRVEVFQQSSFAECSVTDNGRVDAVVRPGCGSKIIRALAESLGGKINLRFGAHGTTATLIFPSDAHELNGPQQR